VVDAYTVGPGDSYACSGRNLRIPSNATHHICTVYSAPESNLWQTSPRPAPTPFETNLGQPSTRPLRNTPEPNVGVASLEMSLTWHELPRPRPTVSPTPLPLSLTAPPS
jgi:hypothetical protein